MDGGWICPFEMTWTCIQADTYIITYTVNTYWWDGPDMSYMYISIINTCIFHCYFYCLLGYGKSPFNDFIFGEIWVP